MSLLCQKLFISGSINNPDVKLNGVTIISKFNRLPTIRNRMPETNIIISPTIECYIIDIFREGERVFLSFIFHIMQL